VRQVFDRSKLFARSQQREDTPLHGVDKNECRFYKHKTIVVIIVEPTSRLERLHFLTTKKNGGAIMSYSLLKKVCSSSLVVMAAAILGNCGDSTSPEAKTEAAAPGEPAAPPTPPAPPAPVPPDPVTKTATLIADQEVQTPPIVSGAIGTGTLTIDRSNKAMSGSVVLDGVTATLAHVHAGVVGANGGVQQPLNEGPAGTWSVPAQTFATDAMLASFLANGLYFNAHSAANTNGEIRGQIGLEVFFANLTGTQEVQTPAIVTAATGAASAVLDPVTKVLSGSIQTAGLTGTVAHVHTGAVGANGGILVALTENPGGSGHWLIPANTILTDPQITTLRTGGLYYNVHSAAHAAGEIRGQIGRKVRYANLNAAQEVQTPAIVSAATGSGTLVIDPNTRAISGQITTTGVTGTVAHVHQGAVGANGGVIVVLTETPAGSGTWVIPANTTFTAVQYKDLLDGNLYYNVHSAAHPAGEIRGQLNIQ
jgi:hypothetical protein